MLNKKKSLLVLIILIVFIIIFVVLLIRNLSPYPENQFGIVGDESFHLSHHYKVNGVQGFEKTNFRLGQKRKIMFFLSNLNYTKTPPTQTDDNDDFKYETPVVLEVKKQDGSRITFLFFKDIEVIKYDQDKNIISQEVYVTTEKDKKDIYKIIGLSYD
ncbi:MAG: hypothetical protein VB095_03655 [Anaerovorax sp.]|nr:hypothetical protein [Anaerovorax sp.]